ncbi:macrolide transporter subunit MacA [Pirellula sp. SH-Sr6A]|nr:macrolide transporter subunit MacA [Pirellula sp. SH-Sr6A]
MKSLSGSELISCSNAQNIDMKKSIWVACATVAIVGGLAFAIPSVRNWIDQAVPSLGINGYRAGNDSQNDPLTGQPSTLASNSNTSEPIASGFPSGSTSATEAPLLVNIDPSNPTPLGSGNLPPSEPPIVLAQALQSNDVLLPGASDLGSLPSAPVGLPQGSVLPSNAVPSSGIGVPPAVPSGILLVPIASLTFVRDIDVAAQADGIITQMHVDEGKAVKQGDPMIELDTRIALAEIIVQTKELEQAKLKAGDQSQILYSEAAFEVAKNEVEISDKLYRDRAEDLSTNQKKKLELKKAELQINVSKIEHAKDKAAVGVSEAKLEAASVQTALRNINAHWDGLVSDVKKEQFDYVRAGEVILRLTDMSKIRVNGQVRVNIPPHLLLNSKARVSVQIAPGVKHDVDGIVGFVAPRASEPDTYRMWVEIDNVRLPDGQFLMREGMKATIEIASPTR